MVEFRKRVTPLEITTITNKEDKMPKQIAGAHHTAVILPSLLDLTSFHRNGCRGTGVGALDVVLVIRHGW